MPNMLEQKRCEYGKCQRLFTRQDVPAGYFIPSLTWENRKFCSRECFLAATRPGAKFCKNPSCNKELTRRSDERSTHFINRQYCDRTCREAGMKVTTIVVPCDSKICQNEVQRTTYGHGWGYFCSEDCRNEVRIADSALASRNCRNPTCNRPLVRKVFPEGNLEATSAFEKRVYCDALCANSDPDHYVRVRIPRVPRTAEYEEKRLATLKEGYQSGQYNNGMRAFSDGEATAIKLDGRPMKIIAEERNVSMSVIARLKRGQTYQHIKVKPVYSRPLRPRHSKP